MVSWTTEFESEWPVWRGDIGVCAPAENHVTRKVKLISKYLPPRIVAVYCNFQQLYALAREGEEKNTRLVRMESETSILNLSILDAHVRKRKFSHPVMCHF